MNYKRYDNKNDNLSFEEEKEKEREKKQRTKENKEKESIESAKMFRHQMQQEKMDNIIELLVVIGNELKESNGKKPDLVSNRMKEILECLEKDGVTKNE